MRALFIIAQRGYQDYEYSATKKVLEAAGIEVPTASKEGGACIGSSGSMVKDTLALADVKLEPYSAFVLIGGPGAVIYQHDAQVHELLKEAKHQHKVLAAICIAPTTLAYAGILSGRKATMWNLDGQQESVLAQQGAKYTGEEVTTDGKIITANGPAAAEAFGKMIIEVLKKIR